MSDEDAKSHAEGSRSRRVSRSRGKRKWTVSSSSSSFPSPERGSDHYKRGEERSDASSLSPATADSGEGIARKKGRGSETARTPEGPSQMIESEAFMAVDGYFSGDDAEYAEELQLQEALHASVNNRTSSVRPQVFCEICLENWESWRMFVNDECSHSFCCECITKHIMVKIEDKEKAVTCPAFNCKAVLDPDTCRLMIPDCALVEWDALQCLSLIPESSKLYCPFNDCSAMLVNDTGSLTAKARCVSCKRSFCIACCVPWHKKLTCEEFQSAKKIKKDERKLEKLAKKKKWQRCPKCKVYVDKTAGCLHMTCRCKYQFCYRCGVEWNDTHDGNCGLE